VVMKNGRVVEEGEADALFGAPRHSYTRSLIELVPRIDRIGARSRNVQ
jgi:peptide/nickel transport system ATP-binding protein